MKECRVLRIHDSNLQALKITDSCLFHHFPDAEQELNQYLKDGWTVHPMGIDVHNSLIFYLEREQ